MLFQTLITFSFTKGDILENPLIIFYPMQLQLMETGAVKLQNSIQNHNINITKVVHMSCVLYANYSKLIACAIYLKKKQLLKQITTLHDIAFNGDVHWKNRGQYNCKKY